MGNNSNYLRALTYETSSIRITIWVLSYILVFLCVYAERSKICHAHLWCRPLSEVDADCLINVFRRNFFLQK